MLDIILILAREACACFGDVPDLDAWDNAVFRVADTKNLELLGRGEPWSLISSSCLVISQLQRGVGRNANLRRADWDGGDRGIVQVVLPSFGPASSATKATRSPRTAWGRGKTQQHFLEPEVCEHLQLVGILVEVQLIGEAEGRRHVEELLVVLGGRGPGRQYSDGQASFPGPRPSMTRPRAPASASRRGGSRPFRRHETERPGWPLPRSAPCSH